MACCHKSNIFSKHLQMFKLHSCNDTGETKSIKKTLLSIVPCPQNYNEISIKIIAYIWSANKLPK